MVNIRDLNRNAFMLKGALSECGYDWWWHSFIGIIVAGKCKELINLFIRLFFRNKARCLNGINHQL